MFIHWSHEILPIRIRSDGRRAEQWNRILTLTHQGRLKSIGSYSKITYYILKYLARSIWLSEGVTVVVLLFLRNQSEIDRIKHHENVSQQRVYRIDVSLGTDAHHPHYAFQDVKIELERPIEITVIWNGTRLSKSLKQMRCMQWEYVSRKNFNSSTHSRSEMISSNRARAFLTLKFFNIITNAFVFIVNVHTYWIHPLINMHVIMFGVTPRITASKIRRRRTMV